MHFNYTFFSPSSKKMMIHTYDIKHIDTLNSLYHNLLDSEKYISKVLELIKPDMSNDELDSLLPWNISKKFILS